MRTLPRTSALLVLLVACGPFDAESRAHRDYVRQLQPLLVENSLLAEQVLTQAAAVYNDPKLDPGRVARAWTADVVPLAEHLHGQATFVEPPEPWAAPHGQLVEIWSDRAQAYRSLAEALSAGDADQWKGARELADAVKLREEEWFRTANGTLAAAGLTVDQYP